MDRNLDAGTRTPVNRGRLASRLVLLAVVVGVLLLLPLRPLKVSGMSMAPTLQDGDTLLLDQFYFREMRRGDVVVLDRQGEQLVKRVVGLPGDQLRLFQAPSGWVTGVENLTAKSSVGRRTPWTTETTLPAGKIYVVGDNLGHSEDSRTFGPLPRASVLGIVRSWTLSREFPFIPTRNSGGPAARRG